MVNTERYVRSGIRGSSGIVVNTEWYIWYSGIVLNTERYVRSAMSGVDAGAPLLSSATAAVSVISPLQAARHSR